MKIALGIVSAIVITALAGMVGVVAWSLQIQEKPLSAVPSPRVQAATTKCAWGPEQATGLPDTVGGGDQATAWASLNEDDPEEWLLLTYDRPVRAKEIWIYETYNPGAVNLVTAFNAEGKEVVIWKGRTQTTKEAARVFKVRVRVEMAVKRVKVYLGSWFIRGWNEIDAVGLRDRLGNMFWAKTATASSTYASCP